MLGLIQQIFIGLIVSLISLMFTRWLDRLWTRDTTNHHVLKVSSEIHVLNTTKQSLSEQINERIFISNWAYYFLTMIFLYCIVALSGIFIFYYAKYSNHPIQDNLLSRIALDYFRQGITPITVVFTLFLYPIVNFVSSRISDLIIQRLKIMSFNFSNAVAQQIRMGTSMLISIVLAISFAYYIY